MSDRIPATDDRGEEPTYSTVQGATGVILGASDKPYPEEMIDRGAGNYLRSTWLPWFRVRADSGEGWLAPSDTRVVWWLGAGSACKPYESLQGLVRQSFLADAQAQLLEKAPAAGDPVFFVLDQAPVAWPNGATCSRAEAAFFAVQGQEPGVVTFACEHPELGKIQVLTLLSSTAKAHYVVDQEQGVHLSRVQLADVGGDAAPELLIELGLRSSHAYDGTLFVAALEPKPALIGLVPLDQEDAVSTWGLERQAHAIAIARTTSGQPIEAQLVSRSGSSLQTRAGHLAVFEQFASLELARQGMFDNPDALLVALDFPVTAWGVAGAFPTQAAACQLLQTRNTPAKLRSIGPNRPCRRKGP